MGRRLNCGVMRVLHAILFGLLVLATGCATARQPPRPKPQAQILPDNRLQGRVAQINAQGQFVVVDFNVGAIPPLETVMNVYRGNAVVGVIRLTGPTRDNLVAGDIVQGEAGVGDQAIWDREDLESENKTAASPPP